MSSTTPVLEEWKHFHTLDHTNFLTCSVHLNMGTISGSTHIKKIFSFPPGICKQFIGNPAVLTILSPKSFIFCIFYDKQYPLQTPTRKIQSQPENVGPGNGSFSSYTTNRELPV